MEDEELQNSLTNNAGYNSPRLIIWGLVTFNQSINTGWYVRLLDKASALKILTI